MRKQIIQMLGNTEKSYYRWRDEGRPIISFLEKYFTAEELEEFIDTGEISRLEINNTSEDKVNQYQEILVDNALYTVKDKLKVYTAKVLQGGGYKLKDILLKALNDISNGLETPNIDLAKQTLIATINTVEITVLKIPVPKKVASVSSWVEYNLSNIEAYVLIKHYKQIFEMIEAESKLK